ncbi:MAG TPA: TetR/AcrR family transcriptional regulator [Acidimicrobiia bacterium]|nr:TetR/AcrR family transcriptional regulator [Acidimicrobiia bacterium]
MTDVEPVDDDNEPAWRQRAVSRSLNAARSRAEKRAQRFLDAAFELMDEKGTTDFTIQEVIDRSKQSLRGFYQYFNGKDELLLALFEESVHESIDDQRAAVDAETEPLARLRAFVIRLHEWCDPGESSRKRGTHNRRPISEFMVQLAGSHPERVRAAIAPTSQLLTELLDDANRADMIEVADTRRTGALVMRTVMYSWFGNRLASSARMRISAEETWQFCLNGLHRRD